MAVLMSSLLSHTPPPTLLSGICVQTQNFFPGKSDLSKHIEAREKIDFHFKVSMSPFTLLIPSPTFRTQNGLSFDSLKTCLSLDKGE